MTLNYMPKWKHQLHVIHYYDNHKLDDIGIALEVWSEYYDLKFIFLMPYWNSLAYLVWEAQSIAIFFSKTMSRIFENVNLQKAFSEL